MAAVVFAGTLPHAVGAMFLEGQMRAIDATATCKNLSYVSLSEMKRLAKRIAKQSAYDIREQA